MSPHKKQLTMPESLSRFAEQDLRIYVERVLAMTHDIRALLGLSAQTNSSTEEKDQCKAHANELRKNIVKSHGINEENIVKILATHRPLETDFRLLIAALKINTDLCRMSNQAMNVVSGYLRLRTTPDNEDINALAKMTQTVDDMIRITLSAFININETEAQQVIARDDIVDKMNLKLIRRLVQRAEDLPQEADTCITLVLITRNIERIGDLCTTIAEEVLSYSKGLIK